MSLKLMYITNDPAVAEIAENAGVDRIFVDMEYIGKADRQGGMDTVQSHHTVEDIRRIRSVLRKAELLVRINPIHEIGEYMGIPHTSSNEEIEDAIEAGADILMLPYFKTMEEVDTFIQCANGRVKTMVLLETIEAAEMVHDLAVMNGLDMIHIGINDLSLEQGKTFMFELLSDGTVEKLCRVLQESGKPYGFGGIAAPGEGLLPAEYIIRDHYRLGSTCVILSRSFCDTSKITDINEIRQKFEKGVRSIREVEADAMAFTAEQFRDNQMEVAKGVDAILEVIRARQKG